MDTRRFGRDFIERSVLSDGTIVVIRPLSGRDEPALVAALAGLTPRSRFKRFLGPRTSFSADELRFLLNPDGEHHVALAAFHEEELVAEARFVRCGPGIAEAALCVADPFQHRGLGALLLHRLRLAALERGIVRFTGPVLIDNEGMIRLLRSMGGRTGLAARGVVDADWRLEPPEAA